MKKLLLIIAFITSVLSLRAEDEGRPKLKELGDKKVERLQEGSKCMEKKGLWGYADNEDKFVINPVFDKVEPFNEQGLAFVAYKSEGRLRWTPISIQGTYLTGLEFDESAVFDKAGFAKVIQGGKYGMLDKEGKLVVECRYAQVEEFEACYVFHGDGLKPLALVHASNLDGCTLHTFDTGEPIVLTASQKCGIVSPHTFELVAPFEFDAYQVVKDFYLLTSMSMKKKAVYAEDKLSRRYDDIVLSPDTTYFITRDMGKYGAMNFSNDVLLPCEFTYEPQLGKDFRIFSLSDNSLVFSTNSRVLSLDAYDRFLMDSCMKTPSRYVLDTLIPHQHKQFVPHMLQIAYGTREYEPLARQKDAIGYAQNKRMLLLSNGANKGAYYDVDLSKIIKTDYCLDRSISVDSHPAFVTVVQNGSKKGLLDVRTGRLRIPCAYDSFEKVARNHVAMKKADSLKIYDLVSGKYEVADKFVSMQPVDGFEDMLLLDNGGKKGIYDLNSAKWLLPAEYEQVYVFMAMNEEGADIYAAEVVKGGVHGVYDLSSGKMLVDCLFNDILNTNLKELQVLEGEKVGVYNALAGEYLIPCAYDEIVHTSGNFYNDLLHRLAVVRTEQKLGLFDLTMKKLILPVKSLYMNVLDGYACVSDGGGYTVIDLKTRTNAFDTTFKDARLLPEGFVIVNKGTKDVNEYGLFSFSSGSWIFEPKKNLRISDLGDNYVGYHGQDVSGVVNYRIGQWACRIEGSSDIQLLDDRFAVITADHNYLKGIYDIKAKTWILNQEYEDISFEKSVSEVSLVRYAKVVNMYSKYGLVDLHTKDFLLGSLYDTMDIRERGVAVVTRGSQTAVFDFMSMNWIVQLTDEDVTLTYNGDLLDVKVGFGPVSRYDLNLRQPYSLPDYNLPSVVEALDESCVAENGLLMVSKAGMWGVYDTIKKALVVPCEYLRIEPMYNR